MKRRFLSFLLLGILVISLIVLPVQAEEQTATPVEVQFLTDAVYEGGSGGGWVTLSFSESNYVFWSPDNHTVIAMEPNGTVLLSGGYTHIFSIEGSFLAAMKNGKYALFMHTEQLSSHIYTEVTREGKLVRCKKAEGSYDLYYLNGQKAANPRIPSGWQMEKLVGDEAVIISAPNPNMTIDGSPMKGYGLCDWNGKLLTDRMYQKMERISDDLVTTNKGVLNTKGQLVDGKEMYFEEMSEAGNYLLRSYGQYHIYDKDLNRLCSFTAVEYSPFFLTDELVAFRKSETEVAVIDKTGEEILAAAGTEIDLCSNRKYLGWPEPWGVLVKNDKEYSFYNMQLQHVLTLENVQHVSAEDEYLMVTWTDWSQSVYLRDGTLAIDRSEDDRLLCVDGILLDEKDGLYAVCDASGTAVTEYAYDYYSETRGYGLINLRRSGTYDYYIVNAAGQELNGEALQRWIEFDLGTVPVTGYTRNGKMGILRYLGPNDSPFFDVDTSDWYFEGVKYCADHELFSGTATAKFSPEDTMTRAMLVTVLWRLEGKPVPEVQETFSDVESGTWYADAVSWAAENGIVNGVGAGKFDPNGNVTREQIAAIMLRYAESKGYDTAQRADISVYPDASSVSAYAVEAISWANAAGIISGSNENGRVLLLPQGNATRAQVATILMRYTVNMIEN